MLSLPAGLGLVQRYFKSSPIAAVIETFPEHNWELHKFKTTPRAFWTKLGLELRRKSPQALKLVQTYIHHIERANHFNSNRDWYDLCSNSRSTGSRLRPREKRHLRDLGGLPFLLRLAYPTLHWEASKLQARTVIAREHPTSAKYKLSHPQGRRSLLEDCAKVTGLSELSAALIESKRGTLTKISSSTWL